jgi:hypothetical protein
MNLRDSDWLIYITGESNRRFKNPHWAVFKAFWRIGFVVYWWQPASRTLSGKLQVHLNCHHQFSVLVKLKFSFICEVLTGSIRKRKFYEGINLFIAVMFTGTENIFRFFHIVAKKSGYQLQVRPSVPPSVCLSVCLSVHLSVRLSFFPHLRLPMGRIFMKFDIGDFYENLLRTTNLVKIGQKYRTIYIDT